MSDTNPAQAEAEGEKTVTVSWEGFEIEVPADPDDWDADALEAFEQGKAITAIRGLVGSRRLDEIKREFQAREGRKLLVRDFGALMESVASAMGFSAS